MEQLMPLSDSRKREILAEQAKYDKLIEEAKAAGLEEAATKLHRERPPSPEPDDEVIGCFNPKLSRPMEFLESDRFAHCYIREPGSYEGFAPSCIKTEAQLKEALRSIQDICERPVVPGTDFELLEWAMRLRVGSGVDWWTRVFCLAERRFDACGVRREYIPEPPWGQLDSVMDEVSRAIQARFPRADQGALAEYRERPRFALTQNAFHPFPSPIECMRKIQKKKIASFRRAIEGHFGSQVREQNPELYAVVEQETKLDRMRLMLYMIAERNTKPNKKRRRST